MSRDPKANYYDAGGIPTQDIIKAKLTPEQYHGFLLGNVIKYSCRMNFKNPEQLQRDAEKTGHYASWLRDELESREAHSPTAVTGLTTGEMCRQAISEIRAAWGAGFRGLTAAHLNYVSHSDTIAGHGYWRYAITRPSCAGEFRFYDAGADEQPPLIEYCTENGAWQSPPNYDLEKLRMIYRDLRKAGFITR